MVETLCLFAVFHPTNRIYSDTVTVFAEMADLDGIHKYSRSAAQPETSESTSDFVTAGTCRPVTSHATLSLTLTWHLAAPGRPAKRQIADITSMLLRHTQHSLPACPGLLLALTDFQHPCDI